MLKCIKRLFVCAMYKDSNTQWCPCSGASFRYIKQVIYTRETAKSKHRTIAFSVQPAYDVGLPPKHSFNFHLNTTLLEH